MATKRSATKKTSNTVVEKAAAGASSARAAKPATSRVKTVKHSKAAASAAEPIAVMDSVPAAPVATVRATSKVTEDPQAVIAQIAYGYWVERGYQGVNQADDWFRAEAEYRQRAAAR